MLVGGLWSSGRYELRLLFRLYRPYCCLSPAARDQRLRHWSVSRLVVPDNIGFTISCYHLIIVCNM